MDSSQKARVVAEALVRDFVVRFKSLDLASDLMSEEDTELRTKEFGVLYTKALEKILLEDFSDEEIDIFYNIKILPKSLTDRLYDANSDAVALATAEYTILAEKQLYEGIKKQPKVKTNAVESPMFTFSGKPNGSLYLSKSSKFSDEHLEKMIKECDKSIKN